MRMEEKDYFLATNLSYLRKQNKMSQNDLGKILGVNGNAIGNYERGERNVDSLLIPTIADYFNVSIDDLLKKDLRFEDAKAEGEEITAEEFKREVKRILDKTNISEEKRKYLEQTLNMIVGDE